jgi:hypothetical protein
MVDKLVTCKRCGGNCCYESKVKRLTTWNCLGCGFTTNNQLKYESAYQKEYETTLPELYKDLAFLDVDNMVWYPCVINFPEKGMVFAQGTSVENWGWTGILTVQVTEEEKEKFKKPGVENEYFTHKMDAKTTKMFKEFMEAADYIGIFGE